MKLLHLYLLQVLHHNFILAHLHLANKIKNEKRKIKKTKNTTTYRSMATLTDVGPQTGTIWNAGDEKLHVPSEG